MKKFIFIMILVLLVVGCDDNSDNVLEGLRDEKEKLETQISQEIVENESLQEALSRTEEEVNTLQEQVTNLTEELELEQEEEITQMPLSSSGQLITAGLEVITLIKNEDYAALSNWVHPSMGVRFSPYFYIDTGVHLVMTPNDIANIASDTSVYNWGTFDGSGDPIDLNFSDYYDRFIYDQDFANPELIGNNTAVQVGNMLDNHNDVYPNGDFVEFHFSGFDPQYQGMDWRSLRLVFVEDNGQWYLVGIVHGEWTI